MAGVITIIAGPIVIAAGPIAFVAGSIAIVAGTIVCRCKRCFLGMVGVFFGSPDFNLLRLRSYNILDPCWYTLSDYTDLWP